MMDQMKIGMFFKELRKEKGLTQEHGGRYPDGRRAVICRIWTF